MELKVQRIHKDARLPLYHHKGDAGLDVFSSVNDVLQAGEVKAVSTGIVIAIPVGFVGLLWDKSGISLEGVHRLAGVIDSGYRGEVKVVMVNLGDQSFNIEKGMKIAQLLVQPVNKVKVVEVKKLDVTSRGDRGFGSTGKY